MKTNAWERRLKDLSYILQNCAKTYFEPDIFRMNLNQFLQTSRTVTFIIQKNKSEIPDFEQWYQKNVLDKIQNDQLMIWAKDSRNKVEKQGDLSMYSSANAKLIFSYLESEDVEFISCEDMLNINVKRLIRIANRKLPSSISDAAVVQIERRWVANSLPDWELLHALTTIYSKMYESCKLLAAHLGSNLDSSIPSPSKLDCVRHTERNVAYIKISNLEQISFDYTEVDRKKEESQIPDSIRELALQLKGEQPKSIRESVEFCSKITEKTFNESGYHVSMVHLLDENYRLIDLISYKPNDQAEKFIFWRMLADRVKSINAKAFISISEAWIRDIRSRIEKPVHKYPIVGEHLHVYGFDNKNESFGMIWGIHRDSDESKPILSEKKIDNESERNSFIFIPVIKALQA